MDESSFKIHSPKKKNQNIGISKSYFFDNLYIKNLTFHSHQKNNSITIVNL